MLIGTFESGMNIPLPLDVYLSGWKDIVCLLSICQVVDKNAVLVFGVESGRLRAGHLLNGPNFRLRSSNF